MNEKILIMCLESAILATLNDLGLPYCKQNAMAICSIVNNISISWLVSSGATQKDIDIIGQNINGHLETAYDLVETNSKKNLTSDKVDVLSGSSKAEDTN